MNSSRVLKFGILAVVIALLVLPKAIDFHDVKRPASDDLKQAIAKLLARQGFETKIADRPIGFVISAHRDSCNLEIREAAPHTLAAIEADKAKDARLVFAFRGELLDDYPTVRATALTIWSRLKWRLGMDSAWLPAVSIAATSSCPIETLPWNEVAEIRAE